MVPGDLEFVGWTNLATVLQQILDAKSKIILPPSDHILPATTSYVTLLPTGKGTQKGSQLSQEMHSDGSTEIVEMTDSRWEQALSCEVWGCSVDWHKISSWLSKEIRHK